MTTKFVKTISIPSKTKTLQRPIKIGNDITKQSVNIDVGDESEIEFVLEPPRHRQSHTININLRVGQMSRVTWIDKSFCLADRNLSNSLRAVVHKEGVLDIFGFAKPQSRDKGSTLCWKFDIDLADTGASLNLYTLCSILDESRTENSTLVHHGAANTKSSQISYGVILGNQGHFSSISNVKIGKNGENSVAHQTIKTLTLGNNPLIFLEPTFEISTPNVSAKHGAIVTNLTNEDLFYLRSRGLPEHVAKVYLIRGFTKEFMENVPFDICGDKICNLI